MKGRRTCSTDKNGAVEHFTPDDRYCGRSKLYAHPQDTKEVELLVQKALREKSAVRVHGSNHSVGGTVGVGCANGVDMFLDEIKSIDMSRADSHQLVVVGSGIHLGRDPALVEKTRGRHGTWNQSLLKHLAHWKEAEKGDDWTWNDGWALTSLGGVVKQSLGGFLGNASTGGTLRSDGSFPDQVVEVEIVSGIDGKAQKFRKEEHNEDWGGLVSHMGLMGVCTRVTLQVVKPFYIKGRQDCLPWDDTRIVNLWDHDLLTSFLTDNDYPRILIYPQQGVRRMQVWRASKHQPYPESMKEWDSIVKPFNEWALSVNADDRDNTKSWPECICDFLDACNEIWDILQGVSEFYDTWHEYEGLRERIKQEFKKLGSAGFDKDNSGMGKLEAMILKVSQMVARVFLVWVESNKPLSAEHQAIATSFLRPFTPLGYTEFCDHWFRGLPMDDITDDVIMPVEFTELFFDMRDAGRVMAALREYWEADVGWDKTGGFAWEIYTATKSEQWASPQWQRDCLRVDPLFPWSEHTKQQQYAFFHRLWDFFYAKGIPFRFHNGKSQPFGYELLPSPTVKGGITWQAYFEEQNLGLRKLKELRAKMDPSGIFLNSYWAGQLGLEPTTEPVKYKYPSNVAARKRNATVDSSLAKVDWNVAMDGVAPRLGQWFVHILIALFIISGQLEILFRSSILLTMRSICHHHFR